MDWIGIIPIGWWQDIARSIRFSGTHSKNARPNPTLDEIEFLMTLNEGFRYWHQPYRTHKRLGDFKKCYCDPKSDGSIPPLFRKTNTSLDPYFEHWVWFLKQPIDIDRNRYRLFPEEFHEKARKWIDSGKDQDGDKGWITYSDNRAFVYTYISLPGGLKEFLAVKPGAKTASWETSCYWIHLLNADVPSCSCTRFEQKWVKDRTYTRWEESGSLYGFNLHSAAMVCPAPSQGSPPLQHHIKTIYFDQVMLLLYIRVCLFNFSNQLSKISRVARTDHNPKKIFRDQFSELRWNFALFTNLYRFPLLSNQQQGIEMFSIARKSMDVDELFDEISQEIQNTSEYLDIQADLEQSNHANQINKIVGITLPFVIASSLLGMNILVEKCRNIVFNWCSNKPLLDNSSLISIESSIFLFIVCIFILLIIGLWTRKNK